MSENYSNSRWPTGWTNISINNLVKNVIQFQPITPVKPKMFLVHPQKYALFAKHMGVKEENIERVCMQTGIRVHQDPFIPLTRTVKKRRYFTKSQQRSSIYRLHYKYHPYRYTEEAILGWWIDEDMMRPMI